MDLSRIYRFRDKREFRSKIADFCHPFVTAMRLKNSSMMPLSEREKSVTIRFSIGTMPTLYGRTDRRTDGQKCQNNY